MSRRNYEVFLSFRGPDTRHTIISHLYNALTQKGIYVFKDSEELEAGQRRSELFDAIEGSRIAIIMFSENYAHSKWCLDELQKIMEHKEQGQLTVLPIFYHVSPGEVRLHSKGNGEKGCYQKAMEGMEEKYGEDSEKVKKWRKALWEGGDLIGIPLDRSGDEGNVVRESVEMVLKILNRVPLEIAKYPVGICRLLRKVRPLLHIDPHVNDVYMIGLLGQGGVGKTTLSKAICNDIADRFDSWCFLLNVRETNYAHLQQTLLQVLLSDKNLTVLNVDEGKVLIKKRLCNKRVLVILDDVDHSNQLDALAGNTNWFGKGSRVIITTRDNHVLTSDRVQHVFLVELLHKEEAIDLFQLHAFGEMQEEINIDGALINSFVKYAGELPLALVVLGAFLRGRSASEWEGKLKELNKDSDKTINSVLKISFDGLEDNHKEMFLDIACFFKGYDRDYVEKILESCDFAASLGINVLIERCLVIVVDGKIQMHDLLEAMGHKIVREDNSKGSGISKRIWLYEDFMTILSENWERQQAVIGIVLNFSQGEKLVHIKSDAFKDFKNLRTLILRNVVGTKKKLQLPRELRWLCLEGFGFPAIEFDPSGKLVGLDLQEVDIRWVKGMGYKERNYLNFPDCFEIKGKGFEELKYLYLSNCPLLDTLPDLSKSWKLEDLNVQECENLTTLVPLNLESCGKLRKVLRLLRSNAVKELPESFGNLVALKKLVLSGCTNLTTIPRSIYKLKALEKLQINDCRTLSGFPRRAAGAASDVLGLLNLVSLVISFCQLKDLDFLKDLTCFETLMELELSGNEFDELPESFSNLVALKTLVLSDCSNLTTIPSSIYKLQALEKLRINDCRTLSGFPRRAAGAASDVLGFPNLVSLDISFCKLKDLEFLKDLTCFNTLMELELSGNEFDYVPACISKFKNLEVLQLHDCGRLVGMSELPSVSTLSVTSCQRLKIFPSLHTFICQSSKWFRVDLSNCFGLGCGYIDRLLPLEKVRGFVGGADVIFPGEEFPHWVNFQTTDYESHYRVSLPRNITENDLLGLALFVSFDRVPPPIDYRRIFWTFKHVQDIVKFEVGGIGLWPDFIQSVDVGHTWFVYIPCQSLFRQSNYRSDKLNWHNLTVKFSGIKWLYLVSRLGLRLLCKREQDDHRIQVCKDTDN